MDLSNAYVSEQGRRRSSSRHGELPLIPTTTTPAVPCASAVLARPANSTFSHDQLAMFHQPFAFHNPNPEHHHSFQRQPQPQLQPELAEDPALLIPSTTSGQNYANPHLSPTAARLELYGLHPYGAFSQPASPHVPSYQNSPAPSSSAEFTWATPAKCPTATTVLTPATGYSIPTHVGDIESIQLPGSHWQQHRHFSGSASAANASPVPQLLVFPGPENSSAGTIAAPVHDFHHLQQHGPADASAAKMGSGKSTLDQQPVFMVNESLDPELGFGSSADPDIDFSNLDLDDFDLDAEQPQQPSSPLSAPSPHHTTLSAPTTPHAGGPRAPKYTPQEWEAQRAHIRRLYLDEDRTLKELIHIMGERYRFHATPRMYNARFRMWSFSKYKKPGRAPSVAGARRRRASLGATGTSGLTRLRKSSGPSAAAAVNSGSGIGNVPSALSAIGAGAAHLNIRVPRTVPASTVQAAMPVNPSVSMMNMVSPIATAGAPLMASPATLTPDVQFGGDFNLFP